MRVKKRTNSATKGAFLPRFLLILIGRCIFWCISFLAPNMHSAGLLQLTGVKISIGFNGHAFFLRFWQGKNRKNESDQCGGKKKKKYSEVSGRVF